MRTRVKGANATMSKGKLMTEDFRDGMRQGAVLFGNTLIETIEEAEAEGQGLTSSEYKSAILSLLKDLDRPKIILDS